MVAFKILALSLLSTAIAAPTAQIYTNDPDYFWSVTEWVAGCARAGCYYEFNITAPAYQIIPAFSAFCAGANVGADYAECTILDIFGGRKSAAAKLLPTEEGSGAHLAFSYQFGVGSDTTYNYTGFKNTTYNQVVSPPLNFTITPTEAWGIA